MTKTPQVEALPGMTPLGVPPEPKTEYLSVRATNALVRKALRDAFGKAPHFSVRTSTYAGGSSTRVRWTDGPHQSDVGDVVNAFQSRGFDGSIDLAYGIRTVLDSDDRVVGQQTEGSVGSGGQHYGVNDQVPEGGRLVSTSTGYLFLEQSLSPAVEGKLAAELASRGYGESFLAEHFSVPVYARDEALRAVLATE